MSAMSTMKLSATLIACIATAAAAPAAMALSVDAPGLARFDNSYITCEAKFPAMRGHRDEAYLSLWRVKADTAALARLAEARKSKPYQTEHARLLQAAKAPAAKASSASPIEQQCQALWGEAQKVGVKTRP